MHAVAHVGRDPGEVGHRSAGKIRIELRERNHPPAAGRIRGDVGVVHERIVLLGVLAGGASQKACRGQPFHISLPGPLMRLDLIGEILTGDGTVRAVIRDPKGISPGQRDVVGQAGMCNGIVGIRHRIIPRQLGNEGGLRGVHHLIELPVLHDDYEDVREGGYSGSGRGLHRRGTQRQHKQHGEDQHSQSGHHLGRIIPPVWVE